MYDYFREIAKAKEFRNKERIDAERFERLAEENSSREFISQRYAKLAEHCRQMERFYEEQMHYLGKLAYPN